MDGGWDVSNDTKCQLTDRSDMYEIYDTIRHPGTDHARGAFWSRWRSLEEQWHFHHHLCVSCHRRGNLGMHGLAWTLERLSLYGRCPYPMQPR